MSEYRKWASERCPLCGEFHALDDPCPAEKEIISLKADLAKCREENERLLTQASQLEASSLERYVALKEIEEMANVTKCLELAEYPKLVDAILKLSRKARGE